MNIASSTSVSSNAPRWRAARKCGSSGIESRVTKAVTSLRILPGGGEQADVRAAVRDHGQVA